MGDVFIKKNDLTRGRLEFTRYEFEKGALAGPIGPNNGLQVPFLYTKGNILYGCKPAEVFG
jgi:hypothetical protein